MDTFAAVGMDTSYRVITQDVEVATIHRHLIVEIFHQYSHTEIEPQSPRLALVGVYIGVIGGTILIALAIIILIGLIHFCCTRKKNNKQ